MGTNSFNIPLWGLSEIYTSALNGFVVGGGPQPDGVPFTITAIADYGYVFSEWTASNTLITFAQPMASTTTVTAYLQGTITASFIPTVIVTPSSINDQIAPKHSESTTLDIAGGPQIVTLSHSTPAKGITIKFAKSTVADSTTGIKDSVTVSVASGTKAQTTSVIVSVKGENGQFATVNLSIQVA